MSGFQKISSSSLRQEAVPLNVGGATCDSFKILSDGKWQFVKCLKEDLQDDPKYDALFRKEYEVGKNLHHPNLVKYNSLERTLDGVCMLMDYVDGETLSERLKNNPQHYLDKKNLEVLIYGLLSCIGYLHSNHVIHLDLKPENIMIRRVDDSPVVLDLGFCYTDAYSSMIGRSEGYAAPEQYERSTDKIDNRTDLYALGGIIRAIDESAFRSSGKHIARQYRNLSEACLKQDPKVRPSDTDACLKMLDRRNATIMTCILSSIICLSLVMLVLFPGHPKFYDGDGTRYRVISRQEKTCEVIGWRKPDSDAGPFVYIKPQMEYHGNVYKTISIADRAFEGDSSILSVFIPEGIESMGRNAFHDCRSIYSITVPNSVKFIGTECFWDARSIEELVLSSSIESLEYNTFVYCCNLQRIRIPEGVKSIGKDCFVSCHALESISLPSTLEEISRGVFFDCTSLSSITIPESVITIGDYAFELCPSLVDVYNLSPVPQPVTSIFGSRASQICLHVPAESVKAYSDDPVWGTCNVVGIE